nr:MAG TPA: hypothetical protein [Herelleviridae sp.]
MIVEGKSHPKLQCVTHKIYLLFCFNCSCSISFCCFIHSLNRTTSRYVNSLNSV